MASADSRPIVLHIGDHIRYNEAAYARFAADFRVVRPSLEERQRGAFSAALREGKWGDFAAILRPFWSSGGEMGRWDRELIALLPASVRVFASAGAGFDWADVDVFAERGILYCNAAAASAEAVADFALFGILSVFRNLKWCITAAASQSPAQFLDSHDNAVALSYNPRGRILGLIGLGNIGLHVAAKAHAAFGMAIHYHDITRKSRSHEASIAATFHADLLDLLRVADCVVLATPSSPSGAKLITAATLASFKPGARFVNIARGSLVDEEALADALDSGALAAAFLDVHEDEPHVNGRLARMRNVTLTCHNAGGTVDTHVGFEAMAMRNVDAVLKGGEALSAVNAHLIV